jgi:homocysteine S-methyltransferase
MPPRSLEELAEERVVLFDGAMGTELYRRHQFVNVCYDQLCLGDPETVRRVHLAYREAGADVLTTNTFGANRKKLEPFLLGEQTREINRAAARLAREAAGDELLVAGSVGPLGVPVGLGGVPEAEAEAMYLEALEGLREGGADFAILETFGRREDLLAAARAAVRTGLDWLPSVAVDERGLSRFGETIEGLLAPFPAELPAPLMLGFNCGVGPAEWLELLERRLAGLGRPVLVQPNAGFPKRVNDRMIYMTSPEYFMTYALHFVQLGARAVGGCCGTTPEHIRALAAGVKSLHRRRVQIVVEAPERAELVEPHPLELRSRLAWKLAHGQWVTLVELVPPLGYDMGPTVERARLCAIQGVDAINVPDGPRASSRVSPLIAAATIQERAGVEVVLHLCCRDRNILGMQSDLLGCAAAGVHNLLIVTGDPPKVGDYPFATAVFDLDSVGFTRIADRLNRGVDIGGHPVRPATRFFKGVGVDPSHLDQARELARLGQKLEAGAEFVITQPVFDAEVLLAFLERVRPLGVPVLAGLWPLASLRNAEFLQNEVPGVVVPARLLERMAAASAGGKEAARAEGVAIARELRERIRPAVAGIQVSAPFGHVQTALQVIAP